jgi:phosphatidylglycerophosphate synthase
VRDSIKTSIIGIMAFYFVLECAIYFGFSIPAGFTAEFLPLFLALTIGFHGLLLFMLLFFSADFTIEATGERLTKVNAANKITLFRVTTLPTLLVLILAAKEYRIRIPLLALIVLVFLSDFADGYISRKHGQVTKVGRMMDSASDYSLLVVLSVVFYYFRLLPLWFFALVLGRLFIQAVFMGILILIKRHIEPKTTMMGKVAVASIMVLYAIEVGRLVFGLPQSWPFTVAEWLAGAIVAGSVVDKIIAFCRELRIATAQKTDEE